MKSSKEQEKQPNKRPGLRRSRSKKKEKKLKKQLEEKNSNKRTSKLSSELVKKDSILLRWTLLFGKDTDFDHFLNQVIFNHNNRIDSTDLSILIFS